MDKLITIFSKKETAINLEHLWHKGLPSIARFCIWPILIGNSLHLNKWTYDSLYFQVQTIRNKLQLQIQSKVGSDNKNAHQLSSIISEGEREDSRVKPTRVSNTDESL